ncbi:mechanosensitive ion channel [Candidatus Woesearchaeota archaeon]|nr:mechanosensitive ion channel [Candidatus Woesearchaeota archaeon]
MRELLNRIADYTTLLFSGLYSTILVAVLILLIGFIIAKVASKIVHRLLAEFELSAALKKATGKAIQVEKIGGIIIEYFVYFITVIMVLNQLHITTTVLHMISAAVLVVIVISISLAVKDFIPNAIAGIYLLKNSVVKVGEVIRVKGIEGKVTSITLVETKLETKEGDTVYVPNAAMVKTEVVKVQKEGKRKGRK